MKFLGLHINVASASRTLMNCWLAYVLSQPVDIDLRVIYQFAMAYIGFGFDGYAESLQNVTSDPGSMPGEIHC